MSLISVILAWFATRGQGADVFLDQLVVVETWFYHASWVLWGIVFGTIALVAIALLTARLLGKISSVSLGGFGCTGCWLAFALIGLFLLPLTSWLTMQFAQGMADAYGPTGIISDAFWVNLALFALVLLSGG